MRSLFLRIFLWFWAAMAVVVSLLVVSSPFFTRSHPGVDRWQRGASQMLSGMVARAADRIERGDIDNPEPDRRVRHRVPMHLYVFDEEGFELRNRDAGREARELAMRAVATGGSLSERSGTLHLEARPVTDADGNLRVVVGVMRRPPTPIDLLDPRLLIPRLVVLTLVAGLFCLMLARYLSSPVAALRRATRGLAGGDLSARVGSPVARRRDEIGVLARDFDAMAERLEQQVEAQHRLLRDVSHELRSPLARLEVALELARQRAGDDAADPLDRIGRESRHLEDLVEKLLSLERLATGAPDDGGRLVELVDLVERVLDDARFEADGRGVEIRSDCPGPMFVVGDPDLLHSAFENVVRNAIAHTAPGGAVAVSIEGGTFHSQTAVMVRVRDHGPGVPPEDLPRIFEPFFRVEDARDRQSGGAGLGLAIAKRAARALGGDVEALNHPGGGLEVTMTLPIVSPPSSQPVGN